MVGLLLRGYLSLLSEEARARISAANKGRVLSIEVRNRISESLRGHAQPEEQRVRRGESLKRYYAEHPEACADIRAQLEGRTMTEEQCLRVSKGLTGRAVSDDTRRRLSEAHMGIPNPRKGISIDDKVRQQISNTSKSNWLSEDFVRRQLASRCVSPNGLERWMLDTLQLYFPGLWRFNGGGPLVIAGHVPDFVDTAGSRWLIEVFGDYWHNQLFFPKRLTDEQLIKLYKDNGYNCQVFGEFDLVYAEVVGRAVMKHFGITDNVVGLDCNGR